MVRPVRSSSGTQVANDGGARGEEGSELLKLDLERPGWTLMAELPRANNDVGGMRRLEILPRTEIDSAPLGARRARPRSVARTPLATRSRVEPRHHLPR
jgi:hypothetical protein